MTTIRIIAQIQYTGIEPRFVSKAFDIDRDLVVDPIEVDDVLHLGADVLASNVLIASVSGGDPPTFRRAIHDVGSAADVDAAVNLAATQGWTVDR